MDRKRIVPRTGLRCLYEFLKQCSTKTQINICADFNRKPGLLINYYIDACEQLAKYDNKDEPFINLKSPRKDEEENKKNKTSYILRKFQRQKEIQVIDNGNYSFEYINKEISPLRTTRTVFENGMPATKSGAGGVDLVAVNVNGRYPVLGEIKIGSDQNVFYALVQLLTYCTELSTKSQIERSQKYLFREKVNFPASLYIILINKVKKESEKYCLIEESQKLAEKFLKYLKAQKQNRPANGYIRNIVCLDCIERDEKYKCSTLWVAQN